MKSPSPSLDPRARQLLRTLISRYIRDGEPVGSQTLARHAGLEVSPATIRNILSELEEVDARAHALAIRVRSQGCASKADFAFRTDRERGRAVVAFARRRLETCRGERGEATLSFSYAELGVSAWDRIVVANPVAARP